MNESQLLLGVLFGAVGLGYFVYGKKQRAFVPLLSGVALMALPYFVASSWLLVLLGIATAAVPYFVRF
jgi:hypothetical protein